MNTKQSIYICGCGPVSGTDDYVERFAECEKRLSQSWGVIIVNPVRFLQIKYNNPVKYNNLESMEWD